MSEAAGSGGRRRPGGSLSKVRGGGGGRRRRRKNKVRATPFPTRLHHYHPLQSRPGDPARPGDSAARTPAASPGPGEATAARAAQYRQLRREVLKTKMVKSEKKMTKPEKINLSHNPSAHRCEQWSLHKPKMKSNLQHTKTLSAKKSDKNRWQDQVSLEAFYRPEKKPLTSAENVRNLKLKELFSRDVNEKEINYAGAKFSDPPSPSDLPKPPSHWVGSRGHHSDQCKALMTFHLKTLLKVQL